MKFIIQAMIKWFGYRTIIPEVMNFPPLAVWTNPSSYRQVSTSNRKHKKVDNIIRTLYFLETAGFLITTQLTNPLLCLFMLHHVLIIGRRKLLAYCKILTGVSIMRLEELQNEGLIMQFSIFAVF